MNAFRTRSTVGADYKTDRLGVRDLEDGRATYSTVLPDFAPLHPTYSQLQGTTAETGDYQAVGSSFLIEHERAILGDDMGLGKCKMTIDAVMHVARDDMSAPHFFGRCDVIIVCKASNIDTWLDEIRQWAGDDAYAFAYRGTNRRRELEECVVPPHCVVKFTIVSYATFRIDYRFLSGLPWDWAILDESQEIRSCPLNKQAEIAKVIHSLNPVRKHALTGTPIMNTPADLWNQLRWIGVEYRSWSQFVTDTLHISTIPISRWSKRDKVAGVKPSGMAVLRSMLQRSMLRRRKDEVLKQLPKAQYSRKFVRMYPDEAREYVLLERAREKAVEEKRNAEVYIQKMQRATSSVQSKVDAVAAILEDAAEAGAKVLVFTQWIETVDMLMRGLEKYNPAVVTGDVKTEAKPGQRSERQQQVDKFQNDPTCSVMVATIQTAGVGLTLTAASQIILVDRPWSPKLVQQAIDRLIRIGQKAEHVLVHSLYAVIPTSDGTYRHTIEIAVHKTLERKTSQADAIVETT